MEGKNYLLITGILTIAGALTGFILNMFSTFFHGYWRISVMVICVLLLITGITGLIYRRRSVSICIILGIAMSVLSIASIPVIFWIGDGTAPLGMILAAFICFIIMSLYLKGIYLNRKSSRAEEYWYAASFR